MIPLISELIYSPTRSWNLAKLEKYLLPMDVQVVRQIPVSYVAQADLWASHHDKMGAFSMRSAYKMIIDINYRGKTLRMDDLNHQTLSRGKDIRRSYGK
jgi:hypothetical protein